jgi:hypothetical protein
MTERHSSSRNRSAVDLSAVVPWKNESGETIPAYGVVQLRTNYDTTNKVSKATKPDSTEGLFYVNGMVSVEATKQGESFVWNRPRVVLLDGNPTVGDTVGPVEGQWYMSTDGTGFKVLRQAEEGRGVVVQAGGSGGGGEIIWFIIDELVCDEYGVEPPYILVTVTDYSGGCSKTPPGAEYGGQYRVYDSCNDFGTAEDMIGTKGIAGYAYPLDGYCEPVWKTIKLCYEPSCL